MFKKIIFIFGALCVFPMSSAEPDIETWRLVSEGDPALGIIHSVCIEGYKFAIYRSRVTSRSQDGTYLGESQSGSLSQIINDKGRGIKCSLD